MNFNQPIAVLFMGVFGLVADPDEARSIVARVLGAVPPGSYLAAWDSINSSSALVEAQDDFARTGAIPYRSRDPEFVASLFDGLDLVEPGLVSISQWRPDPTEVGTVRPVDALGAIARKP